MIHHKGPHEGTTNHGTMGSNISSKMCTGSTKMLGQSSEENVATLMQI
jgi:hypothetical protein